MLLFYPVNVFFIMEDNKKYEEAIRELDAIVRKMESDELDIDTLGAQLKQAKELIKLCRDRLTVASSEVKEILGE